jgi:hypothetical protein
MASGDDRTGRLALGAAGFAGTLVLQAIRTANQAWLPGTMPPIRRDPGAFMIERAEGALPDRVRRQVPERAEADAAQLLAVGYGLTFCALYAAVRPGGGTPLRDGLALGLATWAAGYLGWLSAAGLMPPVWRQRPGQALLPAAEHVAYGVATVAAYDRLRPRA